MISIFRRSRRWLIKRKKIGRYLIYGVGEIVLIVIGILIALTINNWNQRRIASEKEEFYLKGLQTEFERSMIKLENLIEVNRLNYEESIKIAGFINEGSGFPPEEELSELLFRSFSFEISYNPNNSLLNELINSGNLGVISSEELRKALTSWESYIQSIHRQEASLREQRELVVDLFRTEHGSIKTIFDDVNITETMGLQNDSDTISNRPIVESQEFENNLLLFILSGISTENSHYKPLLKEVKYILELIDMELQPHS